MKWWAKIDANNYRLDDSISVAKDWASGRWYVVADGKYMLVDYDDPASAMAGAERLAEGKEDTKNES